MTVLLGNAFQADSYTADRVPKFWLGHGWVPRPDSRRLQGRVTYALKYVRPYAH